MGDSWYSAEKIIKSAKLRGFAKVIDKEDFHLITVNKTSYYVYRYEGKINGFKNVVILISYPENALRSFISTDTSLTVE